MREWPQMMTYIFEKRKRHSFIPNQFNWHSFVRPSSTFKVLILCHDTIKTFHPFNRYIHHILIHCRQRYYVICFPFLLFMNRKKSHWDKYARLVISSTCKYPVTKYVLRLCNINNHTYLLFINTRRFLYLFHLPFIHKWQKNDKWYLVVFAQFLAQAISDMVSTKPGLKIIRDKYKNVTTANLDWGFAKKACNSCAYTGIICHLAEMFLSFCK